MTVGRVSCRVDSGWEAGKKRQGRKAGRKEKKMKEEVEIERSGGIKEWRRVHSFVLDFFQRGTERRKGSKEGENERRKRNE